MKNKSPPPSRPGFQNSRPPFPPSGPIPPRGNQRMISRPNQRPQIPIRRTVSKQDKEMEETMKKLKEMGK